MTHRRRHNWRASPRSGRGFVLITLIALLTIGGLYFFISNLSPEILRANTQQKTDKALTQARDALLGYALQYREYQAATGTDSVYGYLPMPDLGEAQNQNGALVNSPCPGEGCAKLNPAGLVAGHTYIGRFPWRTLGTEPLRGGNGECLWYVVSGGHRSLSNTGTMNWDTLGQIDIVVANGASSDLASVLANRPHDRPVAIIFAPGPPLAGQDRSASAVPGDDVSQCGGNYNPANYLDPSIAAVQGGTSVYFAGNRSVDASVTPVAVAIQGSVEKDGANILHGKCQRSANCTTVANDQGLALTSADLFGALRKSSNFRTDINAMLDGMITCLRDQIVAGSITPIALTGFTSPTDKNVGRIPASTCYDNTRNPRGYFSHYSDQIFVAAQTASPFSVTDTKNTPATADDTTTSCPGVLLFASQRETGQTRSSVAERNSPANYLEGGNLAGFITTGALNFAGPTQLAQVSATASATQTASQDIVRCIPSGASLTVVAPAVATDAGGSIALANYDPGARLLTLGSAGDESSYGASASALFACAWTPEIQAAGSGLRSYFRFRIRRVGEGFTFALIDGDRNGTNVCGAARQHLGYSGDNGITSYIQPPKLAIEFDTARQCNSPTFDANGFPACIFSEGGDTLRNGRNDPCYTTSCWEDSPLYPGTKQSLDNSSHVAIVYWGYGAALSQPNQDDNVHDQADDLSGATPSTPMPTDPSPRPGPRNPAPVLPYVANPAVIPGIAPLDRMGVNDASQREFHARLEVTRTFTEPVDAKDGTTAVQVKFWIEPHSAKSISAMTYNPGSAPTLTVTAASHGLNTGDTVVIRDAVPPGYNGEYPITKIDADRFTAILPGSTPNPGPYISSITWLNVDGTTDQATVHSANHGLADGATVIISGAVPTEFNGTHAITVTGLNTYQFGLELSAQPGSMAPAVAAPKALTPRQIALSNTTRAMSALDASAKPLVANTATIYDEQMAACLTGQVCPTGQRCGSNNMCYRPSFRNLRLGFTTSERPTTNNLTARGQLIEITDRATTWLP
ncbi:MAG: hypothetical protein HZA63_07390 [Rhodocyclales bacterium]|nr:hypothetical protein [Rhodocyclales bacterium]